MEKLKELAGVLGIDCEELYDEVYSEALQEIATRDLAISKILQDLILIRRESSLHADVITEATARPLSSYQEIADASGIARSSVYFILCRYAEDYTWIRGVMKIRAIKKQTDGQKRKKGKFVGPSGRGGPLKG